MAAGYRGGMAPDVAMLFVCKISSLAKKALLQTNSAMECRAAEARANHDSYPANGGEAVMGFALYCR